MRKKKEDICTADGDIETEDMINYEDNQSRMSIEKLQKEMGNYEEVFSILEDNVEWTLETSSNLLHREEIICKFEKPHNSNSIVKFHWIFQKNISYELFTII